MDPVATALVFMIELILVLVGMCKFAAYAAKQRGKYWKALWH